MCWKFLPGGGPCLSMCGGGMPCPLIPLSTDPSLEGGWLRLWCRERWSMGSRNCCSLCELTAARLWTESQVLPMAGEGPCQKEGQEEEQPVTDRPGATSVCI